jgi:hypothetical protein
LARSSTLRRFLRAGTDRLTRGMRYLLALPPEQAARLVDVGPVHGMVTAEAATPLGGLLLEFVALHGMAPQDAARAGDLEPLLRG